MVKMRSLNLIVDPIADASALKRCFQNPSEMMTASGPPGCSSSGLSNRPVAARTPSASKNPGEMR
jgi:hypothetical protein